MHVSPSRSFVILALTFWVFCQACSKTNSNTGTTTTTNPPTSNNPPPAAPEPPKKLIKLFNTTWNNGSINIDSLVYDSSKRVVFLGKLVQSAGSNASFITEAYSFYYNGTDSLPSKYDYTQKSGFVSNPGGASTTTATYGFAYDGQGRIAVDSTITTSASLTSFNRRRAYSYIGTTTIKQIVFPNDTASNSLDSIFLDSDRNTIRRVSGHLTKSGQFILTTNSTSSYGTLATPYGLLILQRVNNVVYGYFYGNKLETSRFAYNFDGTNTYTYGSSFSYTTDSIGLLQKMDVTNTGSFPSSYSQQFVYY